MVLHSFVYAPSESGALSQHSLNIPHYDGCLGQVLPKFSFTKGGGFFLPGRPGNPATGISLTIDRQPNDYVIASLMRWLDDFDFVAL